jgi:ABC-type nickel/cobalt efflux system permease component RcnA
MAMIDIYHYYGATPKGLDATTGFIIVLATIFGTALLILLVDWLLMRTPRHYAKRYEKEKKKARQ